MLKKRTAIPAMIFCGSLLLAPGLSQASPLAWMPGPDALAKIARWWDLLPGLGHHAPAAKPAPGQGTPVKNGCGIDPNGGTEPACGTSGATAPTSTDPGSGL
jgi:hypothetical protein